jgi:hypothetical protein
MLQLIAYDLGSRQGRDALDAEIHTLASACHNIPFAPWLVDCDRSAEDVLVRIDREVVKAQRGLKPPESTRRLLVMPLTTEGESLVGACRGFDGTCEWLAEKGLALQDDEWRAPRVLIVVSTLWGASAADRSRLRQAIADRFPESCHPLLDLWLINTSLAPAEVLDYLEGFLPDRKAATGKEDGLLVLVAGQRAVESGLERVRKDVCWMWEHGVAVKHRRPPAPVAHAV